MQKKRVLVIDDECLVQGWDEILPTELADLKEIELCPFFETDTIEDAIDKIHELRPDIVLLDGNLLGEFVGPKIAEWCRAQHPEILIIANSIAQTDEAKASWFQAGVRHFAQKDIDRIKACITGTCDCSQRS